MAVAMAAGAAVSALAWVPLPICSTTGSTSARSPTGVRCIAASMSRSSAATCSRPCRPSAPPAVARQVRLRGAAAILTGRLFDDRGNRMSPTHANKRGVRYRYYVSHAILQKRRAEAGNIARVPAPEIETLVCEGIRRLLAAMGEGEPQTALADRELVQRHVARVI